MRGASRAAQNGNRMRPKTTEYRRRLWKQYPLIRPGITFSARDHERIKAFYEAGDLLSAQRLILDRLRDMIDGPPFRVSMLPGQRKRLVMR